MTLPSLYRLLRQHRESYPEATAVVEGEARLGYPELFERVLRVSNHLAAAGLGEGGRILWLGQNSYKVLELLAAASRLGAMLCVANWRQSASEIEFILSDFDPQIVVWQNAEVGDVVLAARSSSGSTARWIRHDGESTDADSYEAFLAGGSDSEAESDVEPATDRPLLVLYTGSFDGRPAGAQLSDLGLFLQAMTHIAALGIGQGNRALVSTPMFHIVAWLDLLPTLFMGGLAVIARRTEAELLAELIDRERIQSGRIQPVTASQIADLNTDGRFDLSSLRSSLPVPGWREMTRYGTDIGGTGQTEVAGPIVVGAWAGEGSTPFCGRIAPIAEAKIVDEGGAEVPAGELGELLIRGPTAGLGYWRRPELNARRFREGWWYTGDLARRDADGTISFVAPKGQMLKSAGENIYAAEVESCIKSHPDVANAAIIGLPDEKWTQRVLAIVVKRAGADVSERAIIDHVRERIARYKAPREVRFVEEIPVIGFVPDYGALDARFGGGNYPGEAGIASSRAARSD